VKLTIDAGVLAISLAIAAMRHRHAAIRPRGGHPETANARLP